MKRFKLINTSLGWLCFAIAAITYLMTLEPTASFWDCPEFILQGYKQEVGHPPGNPIFVMTARLFINFVGGDVTKVAVAVNAMSAILSALTVMFLFWTITHLVRRLLVSGADAEADIPLGKQLAIFGSGICGALMYAWSDTFWFSAVEGEVYAFSSFCTAIVFWLILKWEDVADEPHSDRYLILIAYVIGLSIGVHLLNLLCIPAIGLVIYYRKTRNTTAGGSMLALLGSAVVIALILYGLMPGFIENAGLFELMAVNTMHMGYNSGVIIYALLFVAANIWCIYNIYTNRRRLAYWSLALTAILSGMPFIGGWLLSMLLIGALFAYLFLFKPSMRIMGIVSLSILVIFIGYSSYALLLIRASANPAVNQNAPDNVFELKSYISREQYGETPLLYGQSFESGLAVDRVNNQIATRDTDDIYRKAVKTSADQPDEYVTLPGHPSYVYEPNMLFPRMYSTQPEHIAGYKSWGGIDEHQYNEHVLDQEVYKNGQMTRYVYTPTQGDNLRYFINYQLNHMYWRYFLWNFAGRQNDIQGNGEPNRGNWISGIAPIDNYRLGDQSLLPDEYGEGNAGHNVYYMLPLLMGLLGLFWQAFRGKRGIEQFWVVFFLFFMTGIAIVLYLNQVPNQPRERDYAFAGSFYAFAIWVGMGVAAIWSIIMHFVEKDRKQSDSRLGRKSLMVAGGACVVAIAIPLQVVSQTWDDHDRSGRYTTRDYGMNYLAGLDKDAIIFTNGDNDTFPLWYAQEVEGYRTDVRVVNLSYLATEWYANQMRLPSYDAPGIKFTANADDYAYERLQYSAFDLKPNDAYTDYIPVHPDTVNIHQSLKALYGQPERDPSKVIFPYPAMYIDANAAGAVKAGIITADEAKAAEGRLYIDLYNDPITCTSQQYYDDNNMLRTYVRHPQGVTLSQALSLDLIANSVADGWSRPVYFSMTVPDSYYVSLSPYLFNTGLSYELTPLRNTSYSPDLRNVGVNTDKMYRNVMESFRWGGLDGGRHLYLDETVRRMVDTHRQTLIGLARELVKEGAGIDAPGDILYADNQLMVEDPATGTYSMAERRDVGDRFSKDRFDKARKVLALIEEKLPESQSPWAIRLRSDMAEVYLNLGRLTGDKALTSRGLELLESELVRYGKYIAYYDDLRRRGMYNQLSALDAYVPRYIYSTLLIYGEFGDLQALDDKLRQQGVDINRLNDYLQ